MKKIIFWGLLFMLFSSPGSRNGYASIINTFNVSPASVTFADQDPDLGQVTSSPGLSVTISIIELQQNQDWTLEICADTDLVSGGNAISAGNIQWTVTGSGNPTPTFYNGTFAKGVYIMAGTGKGNRKNEVTVNATFNFILQNYWSYVTGNYSGTVTFRLSSQGATSQTRTVTLSMGISARAKLTFGSSAISFPSANPDSVPSIPANVNPISVTSSARTGSSQTANLTCLASGDLISGTSTIAVSNITWTATGTGYLPGAMNRITAQGAGSWNGPGQRIGTFSYFFVNSWSYTIGNYSASINYTLTVP
jgi:hypothetical protein